MRAAQRCTSALPAALPRTASHGGRKTDTAQQAQATERGRGLLGLARAQIPQARKRDAPEPAALDAYVVLPILYCTQQQVQTILEVLRFW